MLSREEGKTRAEGIDEATRAYRIVKLFAGECLRLLGEAQSSVRPTIGVEITRDSSGVVRLIAHWNFPSPFRPERSLRAWPTATAWSRNPPTSCVARPGRWPTSSAARASPAVVFNLRHGARQRHGQCSGAACGQAQSMNQFDDILEPAWHRRVLWMCANATGRRKRLIQLHQSVKLQRVARGVYVFPEAEVTEHQTLNDAWCRRKVTPVDRSHMARATASSV